MVFPLNLTTDSPTCLYVWGVLDGGTAKKSDVRRTLHAQGCIWNGNALDIGLFERGITTDCSTWLVHQSITHGIWLFVHKDLESSQHQSKPTYYNFINIHVISWGVRGIEKFAGKIIQNRTLTQYSKFEYYFEVTRAILKLSMFLREFTDYFNFDVLIIPFSEIFSEIQF